MFLSVFLSRADIFKWMFDGARKTALGYYRKRTVIIALKDDVESQVSALCGVLIIGIISSQLGSGSRELADVYFPSMTFSFGAFRHSCRGINRAGD